MLLHRKSNAATVSGRRMFYASLPHAGDCHA